MGVGYEAKVKLGTVEGKVGAAYKINQEIGGGNSKLSKSVDAGASFGPTNGPKAGESVSVEQTVLTTNGQKTTGAEKPEVNKTDSIGGNTSVSSSSSSQVGLGLELPLSLQPIVGGIEGGTTREGIDAAKDIPGQIRDSLMNPGPPPQPIPPKPPTCAGDQKKPCQ